MEHDHAFKSGQLGKGYFAFLDTAQKSTGFAEQSTARRASCLQPRQHLSVSVVELVSIPERHLKVKAKRSQSYPNRNSAKVRTERRPTVAGLPSADCPGLVGIHADEPRESGGRRREEERFWNQRDESMWGALEVMIKCIQEGRTILGSLY
ncbi:hypothetical protein KSP40_PGU014529 [Platanthera guangdongensis]|uniref:Uncharacterized protein n=1 Tax=Platanthera guangdongensis TaxID=2320717 RepID=A0ABR2MCM9_9ASPA